MHFTTLRSSNGSVLYADELVFWRVRLGYSTSRVVLPTAGSAAMRHSPQVAWWLSPQTTVFNTIRAGSTFGGGLESAIGNGWSAKLELSLYGPRLFHKHLRRTGPFNPFALSIHITDNIVCVEVDYRFQ